MVFRAGRECWVHWVLEVLKLRLTDEFQEMHRICALCEKYLLDVLMFSKERAMLLSDIRVESITQLS